MEEEAIMMVGWGKSLIMEDEGGNTRMEASR